MYVLGKMLSVVNSIFLRESTTITVEGDSLCSATIINRLKSGFKHRDCSMLKYLNKVSQLFVLHSIQSVAVT